MKIKNLLIYQGIPLFMVLLPFVWYGIVGNDIALKREDGIIENMTVIFLLVSIGFYISAFFKASKPGLPKNLKVWLVILIVGAAYFALEEISYGQHMFGWDTADTWKELNDQGETNLHNVHPLFDQLPRLLLTLGILIGGVLMPLYRYFRKISLEESYRFYWQLPTIDCLTIGLLVILVRPVLSIFEIDFINTGETKENFIALFIMLYSISIQSRLKHKAAD